ncbi:putative apoptosis-antagonizing transcription factor, AATF leucine zipper-containing [Septoria linicola]|nr:putative apoptosis-antagonizing transcription factor, AATF leucine zipper-containing [Septoria linicola]
MAPNTGHNRASEFDEYMQTGAKDFDPEEDVPLDDSDDESPDDGHEDEGREHYAAVGKSRLRKPKEVALGPQYRGSKVRREDLDAESDEEDEGDSEGQEMSDGDELDGSDDSEGSLDDGTDETDFSDEHEDRRRPAKEDASAARKEIAAIQKEEQRKAVSTTLSEAGRLDAEKGRAVKRQRTAFDALLNTRMKLQKSLVAANTLVGTAGDQLEAERSDAQQAMDAAETAAFNLWNSLNTFREDLAAAKTGQKRKRAKFSSTTPTEALWSHFQVQELESRPARDAVLKKWSNKTQGPTVQAQAGRLNQTAQATIIDVIQEQLAETNLDRLIKRAHAPRSCAPLQVSQRITEDSKIYDDADFYGLLLKELLEQKSADSVAASNIDIGFQMRRDNKTKKNVDTKASKGRKLRYTVHEKLQNFMAPEDKTSWGERQSDELFSSLFGQRVVLGEPEAEDEEMANGDEDATEGVMLFGR